MQNPRAARSAKTEMAKRLLHVSIDKQYLIGIIRSTGSTDGVLVGFDGTAEEAIAACESDPREAFVMDATCDRQDATGRCLGHES